MTWLTRLREVGERATQGAWCHTHIFDGEEPIHALHADGSLGTVVAHAQYEADGRFIEVSHNVWPLIVAALEAAKTVATVVDKIGMRHVEMAVDGKGVCTTDLLGELEPALTALAAAVEQQDSIPNS